MSRRRKKKKSRKEADAAAEQVELLPRDMEGERMSGREEGGAVESDPIPEAAASARPDLDPPTSGAPHPDPSSESEAERGQSPHEDAARHGATRGAPPPGPRLREARELVASGRVQEAIVAYRALIADEPEDVRAHNDLGVLYDELKRHDLAEPCFRAAAALDPSSVHVMHNLGSCLTSLGRYDEAESLLRRARRLAPEDVEVRFAAGVLAYRRGLYEQAASELLGVCARDGLNGAAHFYLGEALNRVGRFQDAADSLERAAELMPHDPRPVYTLGHLYDRLELPERAQRMYRRARDLQVGRGS